MSGQKGRDKSVTVQDHIQVQGFGGNMRAAEFLVRRAAYVSHCTTVESWYLPQLWSGDSAGWLSQAKVLFDRCKPRDHSRIPDGSLGQIVQLGLSLIEAARF